MLARATIWIAIVVYVTVVLGCVLPASQNRAAPRRPLGTGPSTASMEGLPYRGVAMQLQRVDWIDDYKHCIDEIADLGADSVLLIVDARQENCGSKRIYLDLRLTPSFQNLGDIIDRAKQRKLRVLLMPIVLLDAPRGTEWRGLIKPDGDAWEEWFESYRNMLMQYAIVAQNHGVDVLVVGSELVSTESKTEQWRRTIDMARDIYKGRLTYSSNWDHYQSVPFWDQLDMIGMNTYWTLGKDEHVTVPQVREKWADIQRDLLAFVQRTGKPLLFTEVGWCSLRNAASAPWDYTQEAEPIDLDLQKRLWEGFFESWHGNSSLGGFMVWAWRPFDGGDTDRGYSPKGKPAEQVVRRWLGTPWDQTP